jgi:hypothetical protein
MIRTFLASPHSENRLARMSQNARRSAAEQSLTENFDLCGARDEEITCNRPSVLNYAIGRIAKYDMTRYLHRVPLGGQLDRAVKGPIARRGEIGCQHDVLRLALSPGPSHHEPFPIFVHVTWTRSDKALTCLTGRQMRRRQGSAAQNRARRKAASLSAAVG